jgi:hypothetical protein
MKERAETEVSTNTRITTFVNVQIEKLKREQRSRQTVNGFIILAQIASNFNVELTNEEILQIQKNIDEIFPKLIDAFEAITADNIQDADLRGFCNYDFIKLHELSDFTLVDEGAKLGIINGYQLKIDEIVRILIEEDANGSID